MTLEGRDRIPWWAMLVHAPLARVRDELAKIRWTRTWDDDAETAFVSRGAWTGVYRYAREAVDFALGDKLRAAGLEVILLDRGDRTVAHRWVDGSWTDEDDRGHALEAQLGFGDVHAAPPDATTREAALFEGATLAGVQPHVADGARLVATPRGVVALGDDGIAGDATYRVMHVVDEGRFYVYVGEAVFQRPAGQPTGGAEELASVEGETEPRAIVQKLGIPVDYIFPEGA